MIILKLIIWLTVIVLVLLNVALIFIIYYFYSNRKIVINIDTNYVSEEEKYYIRKAKEIIRKEGEKDD